MSKAVEMSYKTYPLNNPDDLYTNAKRVGYKQGFEEAEDMFESWLKEMFISKVPVVYTQEKILEEFNKFKTSDK
jgi:hypothetical protein